MKLLSNTLWKYSNKNHGKKEKLSSVFTIFESFEWSFSLTRIGFSKTASEEYKLIKSILNAILFQFVNNTAILFLLPSAVFCFRKSKIYLNIISIFSVNVLPKLTIAMCFSKYSRFSV